MKIQSGGKSFDFCFLTTTYRGDLDRFAVLRESLQVFGQGGIPHYALINTEDVPLLAAMKLPDVIPLASGELLPPIYDVERKRYQNDPLGQRWAKFRRSLNKRFGWSPNARYFGWHVQQLLKLKAPTVLPHDIYVTFDSDNVITGPMDLRDYVPGGNAIVYESEVPAARPLDATSWYGNACRLLDVPIPPGIDRNYVNQPVVFEKRAMHELHAWLERRYCRPWHESVLDQRLAAWSEFMIYGVFVRHHLRMEGFTTGITNSRCLWIRTLEDRQNADQMIHRAFQDPAIQLLVLQADHHKRWPLQRFMPFLEQELAAARKANLRTQSRSMMPQADRALVR
jgi:Family of unknown function (DUF6492)